VLCFSCGAQVELPVEPLYDLKTTAALLPCSVRTLQGWLSTHRADVHVGPKLYIGSWGHRHRLLRAPEIHYIRSRMVSGHLRKPTHGSEAARAVERQAEGHGEA